MLKRLATAKAKESRTENPKVWLKEVQSASLRQGSARRDHSGWATSY